MRPEKMSPPESTGVKSAAAILHELRWRQKVLLVGGPEFRQGLRASILRANGLQVDAARNLADGRSLWLQNGYDWVWLEVHSLLPGEVLDFCEQLRNEVLPPRIAFLVGPPTYVSVKWPREEMTEEKAEERCGVEFEAAA